MGFIVAEAMYSKGKVHPCFGSAKEEHPSVPKFKFLPETIITLSIALPPEDQEVLFYLIAYSLNASWRGNGNPNQGQQSKGNSNRKGNRKGSTHNRDSTPNSTHKLCFECSCFECYMSFWGRWNGSPNRDLIHKGIEIFEDHVSSGGGDVFSGKSGKKVKAREEKEKLQAKQLITWLESNSADLAGGKQRGALLHKGEEQEEEEGGPCIDGETRLDGGKKGAGPRLMKQYESAGSERTFMKRMLPDLMGFFTENLRTVWSPLTSCKV